jgi:nicotinamidase-related amidase
MTPLLEPKKTSLLLLDIQNGFLARLPQEASIAVLHNAASAVHIARKHGVHVTYVRAALTDNEIAAIPDHNTAFAAIKASKEVSAAMHPDSLATQIHSKIAPQDGDTVHRKIRFGTFMRDPSMAMLDDFSTKGIDTVVIGGVITSGAVLSAVRQLADLDFRLLVLEDCCTDYDEELHNILCEKVLSKQARVIKSTELEALF